MAYIDDLKTLHNTLIQLLFKSAGDDDRGRFVLGSLNMIAPDYWTHDEYVADMKNVKGLFEKLVEETDGDRKTKYANVVNQLDILIARATEEQS